MASPSIPLAPIPRGSMSANSNSVVRFPYKTATWQAMGKAQQIVSNYSLVHQLTRDVAFSPDGKDHVCLRRSVLQTSLRICPPRLQRPAAWRLGRNSSHWVLPGIQSSRADVLTFTPDGKTARFMQRACAIAPGAAIQPQTQTSGACQCTRRARRQLPFEYATHVKEGAFYGWPWYYTAITKTAA